MEINNKQEIKLKNNIINEREQNNFLKTILGKTINAAIDIGIRKILPNYLENQIINIKNNIIENGLKEGINKTIEDAINIGKSSIGIITGDFENINQVQAVIKNGGIIDGISSIIDSIVNKLRENGKIKIDTALKIKEGKNFILENIENNIENTYINQLKSAENTNRYINNWKKEFENKNFSAMEKEYKKIEKELKNLVPIEKTIKEARTLENIHNLIKNKGMDFNLTKEEIELAKKI